MLDGFTFRNRMPNRVRKDTGTPEAQAVIHSPTGMNRKKMTSRMKPMKIRANTTPRLSMESSTYTSLVKEELNGDLRDRSHHMPVPVALHHLNPAALGDKFPFGDHIDSFLAHA